MGPEWISRAEAGRRLGVSAMAVTKFTRRGMPHRLSDGRVPWPDGLYWSDWYRHARDESERAARELRRSEADAWYEARQAGMDAASVANRAILPRAGRESERNPPPALADATDCMRGGLLYA
jgi:hypothetical protein